MVKVTTSPSGLSPATAVVSPRARIDSANSADSAESATMAAMDATADKARSIQFDDEAIRGHGSEEYDEGEDEEAKVEFGDVKTTAELLGEVEELSRHVSQMGRPLPVGRNPAAELEDDADDDDDDEQCVAPGDRPPLIPRETRNADTPSANRVQGRLCEKIRSDSEWMMMFAPVAMPQEKWPVLGPELTQPVNSTDINQLAEDTVLLLKAIGYRCNGQPNSLILGDWSLSRAGAELLKRPRLGRGARYVEFYDATGEEELGGGDSDDGRDYRDSAEDSAKDVIPRLNLDDAESYRGLTRLLSSRWYPKQRRPTSRITSAGIRFDLYNSLAKLPDEVVVPLIKSQNSADDPRGGLQITDCPTEIICLPGRVIAEFRVRRRQPAESTHELWCEVVADMVPSAPDRDRTDSYSDWVSLRLPPTRYGTPLHLVALVFNPTPESERLTLCEDGANCSSPPSQQDAFKKLVYLLGPDGVSHLVLQGMDAVNVRLEAFSSYENALLEHLQQKMTAVTASVTPTTTSTILPKPKPLGESECHRDCVYGGVADGRGLDGSLLHPAQPLLKKL
ncbi:unnamed protein product [Phytophthora fragariaefolia]|uniref:Unnamed protein product n=1 Tax=Phytophthora fragariaefolia TaxID=1490495 RepID=A0A9W6XM22_9STRA|nr:unnamed protein product [Phytophthora fragariaefolia]